MSSYIVTIGGGSIANTNPATDTFVIDQEIVKLTGKKSPHVLFIPTASSDDAQYIQAMKVQYEERLKCSFSSMCLLTNTYLKKEAAELVQSADIIYVGGGNTLMMMKLWRRLGIDTLLKTAHKSGTIMCGLSAGSICWYDYGHSDSQYYFNPDNWQYIRVKSLGLLQGIHCPHYNSSTDGIERRDSFINFMNKFPQYGIAVDNCCSLILKDDSYRVLSSQPNSYAYILKRVKGKVVEKRLKEEKKYKPIDELYAIINQ